MTQAQQRHYLICCQVYKILNSLDCLKCSDYFKLNSSVTRSHGLTLVVPPSRTVSVFRYSCFVNSVFFYLSQLFLFNHYTLLKFVSYLSSWYIVCFFEFMSRLYVIDIAWQSVLYKPYWARDCHATYPYRRVWQRGGVTCSRCGAIATTQLS